MLAIRAPPAGAIARNSWSPGALVSNQCGDEAVSLRTVIALLAGAMGAGLCAVAQPIPEGARFGAEVTDAPAGRDTESRQPLIWGKGQHLPDEFRGGEFHDWQTYHLSAAPEGYRWVRVERGAYRVKIDDGYIAEAIFGLPAN